MAMSTADVTENKVQFRVQTAADFLNRPFPPKEPLVEGLLYRRDLVAFAGRRRHGKTTLLSELATALTISETNFLGYPVAKPLRVVVFFLEDDAGEVQEKLRLLMNGRSEGGRLAVYTREDFYREGIPVDLMVVPFQRRIETICAEHCPDVIILDNLAHLIGADYNNAKKIHEVMRFAWKLTTRHNSAVVIAAHPRKRQRGKNDVFNPKISLRSDPESFFEEVMGSSHFVNSCGSLWGLERDIKTNRTDFLGGAQRFTGSQSLVILERADDGRFRLVSDYEVNLRLATNTQGREQAWDLFPEGQFSYTEAEKAVRPALKSTSSFYEWFTYLQRLGLVVPSGKLYSKVVPPTGT